MLKIGVSGGCVELTEENLAKMSKAGITAVELSSSPVFQSEADYGILKKTAEKYGVDLWSCHLPFYPFEDFDGKFYDIDRTEKLCDLIIEYARNNFGEIFLDIKK